MSAQHRTDPMHNGAPLPELIWLSIVGAAVVALLLLALRLPHDPQPLRSKTTPVAPQAQTASLASERRLRPAWRIAAQD